MHVSSEIARRNVDKIAMSVESVAKSARVVALKKKSLEQMHPKTKPALTKGSNLNYIIIITVSCFKL